MDLDRGEDDISREGQGMSGTAAADAATADAADADTAKALEAEADIGTEGASLMDLDRGEDDISREGQGMSGTAAADADTAKALGAEADIGTEGASLMDLDRGEDDISREGQGMSGTAGANVNASCASNASSVVPYDHESCAARIQQEAARIFKVAEKFYAEEIEVIATTSTCDTCDFLIAAVSTIYLHALRVHFLSRPFYSHDLSYQRFDDTIQDHLRLFLLFDNDHLSIETIRNTFITHPFRGDRSFATAVDYLLSSTIHQELNIVNNVTIPFRDVEKSTNCDSFQQLHQVLSDGIRENLEGGKDPALVFIDFASIDNPKKVCHLPTRIGVEVNRQSDARGQYVYQTVGAFYQRPSSTGDKYACRILCRKRLEGGFYYRDHFYPPFDVKEGQKTTIYAKKLQFLETNEEGARHSTQTDGMFPPSLYKGKAEYEIAGLMMCLNAGQKEGLFVSTYPKDRFGINCGREWRGCHYVLTRLDPIVNILGNILRTREVQILNSSKGWISDEIIDASMAKHLIETLRSVQSKSSSEIISPIVLIPARAWIFETYMDWKTHNSGIPNIFDEPNWFLTIINYPQDEHWIFVCLNAAHKLLVVYDPQYLPKNISAVIGKMTGFIDLEADAFVKERTTMNSAELKANWIVRSDIKAPRQPDVFNCGVLALIAFFRAVNIIFPPAPGSSPPEELIIQPWDMSMSQPSLMNYRLQLKNFLTGPDGTEETLTSLIWKQ